MGFNSKGRLLTLPANIILRLEVTDNDKHSGTLHSRICNICKSFKVLPPLPLNWHTIVLHVLDTNAGKQLS